MTVPSIRPGPKLAALLLWGSLTLVQGCGDEPPGVGETPATEPRLTLLSVVSAGGGGWQRGDTSACVELGRDANSTLITQLRIDGDWLLRPLHNCQSRTRCGYIEVSVTTAEGDVLLTQAAASLSVNLPFAGVPLTDGDSLTFTARLMDQDGNPYLVSDGGLCGADDTCSVTLAVAQHCAGSMPQTDGSTPSVGGGDGGMMPVSPPGPADAALVDGAADLVDATLPPAPDAASHTDAATPGPAGSDASAVGDAGTDAGDAG